MKLRQLFDDSENERGVSPVIGVILMVAITVILAAVIGTFVLGLGESVNTTATAGVSVDDPDSTDGTKQVTVTSLGSNTEGVYCTDGGTATESSPAGVGTTESCNDGSNVVAVGSGNTQNAVIRSNI